MKVFTYYDDFKSRKEPLIDLWKEAWSKHGWNPTVLKPDDAQRHVLQGNCDGDSQRDSQTSVPLSPDLSQVVTAWEKLPAPLKAAILAIVKSAEGQP